MTSDEFGDCLNDLIGSALLDRMPVHHIANRLLQTTVVLAAACEINPDDLLADLSEFAIEIDNDHHRSHLH